MGNYKDSPGDSNLQSKLGTDFRNQFYKHREVGDTFLRHCEGRAEMRNATGTEALMDLLVTLGQP